MPPSRWGPAHEPRPALPTAITSPMTSEQLDAYVVSLRINEITDQLRTGTPLPLPPRRARCPSPPPEYDATGRRTNTREKRHRARLERERAQLVRTALATIPGYQPPFAYRRQPTRVTDKIYIPTREHPGVNFIGQILGPRGSSLKEMNAKSGANIVLRGRGSVKGGRGGRGGGGMDDPEPLHCLVTADGEDKLARAKRLVQEVIDMAGSTLEYDNERKREQLRGLAMMNGTFRDDEASRGRLIGLGQEVKGANGQVASSPRVKDDGFDAEYDKLMEEIGGETKAEAVLPPWRRGRMAGYGRAGY